MESKVSVGFLRNIIYFAASKGASVAELCEAAGIAPELLLKPDEKVAGQLSHKIWLKAEQLTGDSDIGLHLGEQIHPSTLGLVGFVMLSRINLGDALEKLDDDAQAGPDHVDAHRSPALVISAYNRKGALIHDFHNTVSLIRTMELLLGIKPMNLLDAAATPIDIFQEQADLTAFKAVLPTVALDNLFPPAKISAAMRVFMNLTAKQDLTHQDMANPQELNEIIWFSVRGEAAKMPEIARLPAFDLMTAGLKEEIKDEEDNEKDEKRAGENDEEHRRVPRNHSER